MPENYLKSHLVECKTAIRKTDAFKKKKLCTHSIDLGVICDHGCSYCSTPSNRGVRTRPFFKAHNITSQDAHNAQIAYIYSNITEVIQQEAPSLTSDDVVMFCTKVDPYCPAVQAIDLFRDCLETLLINNSECKIRILSKNDRYYGCLTRFY